jgi:hypothetical protein
MNFIMFWKNTIFLHKPRSRYRSAFGKKENQIHFGV